MGCVACLRLQAAAALDLTAEWRIQHAGLERQMADRAWCERVAAQVEHPAALIEAGDRDPLDVVLRRSRVLLDHLRACLPAPGLAVEAESLQRLERESAALAVDDKAGRYRMYERACALRRRIAFRNPLLDFERIVFLTRHRTARGDHHMVDQYCGFNQRPGGSVMVLERPFGGQPEVRDLMAGRRVAAGRLAGRALEGGSFTTLDLDYDGCSIAFAWSECGEVPADADWSGQPWDKQQAERFKKPHYHWSPQTTYHVFRMPVDAGPVRQLTDGRWNDFDPCFLPDGRIAFISERRGGFLRCGDNRPNPTFTLHSMSSDGTGIATLSFHETQEWNPSVDHDGMIAYTRWDYVDRDNDMAHHLWLCYPDGRDPRSHHSNYPLRREIRPWMELAARAIPGSPRHVAVAAAHHGYHYGSLVLIDQTREDDNAMGQIRRLTPEALFPESESAPGLPHPAGRHSPLGEVYATPWPLDEWFHLCVYDPEMKRHGVYLVDAFGNKELLYRDSSLTCLDPVPLRARKRPPVIPAATTQAGVGQGTGKGDKASVAIVNVYESDFAWPAGAKVAAIRVVQLFPKSTFSMNDPMVGRGAESLVRGVAGTAPVAADGSAHFEAPVGVPLYFQALDEEGMAIQSMRSATYLHPGERLTCVGCHESKHRPPPMSATMPLAWRSAPAPLQAPPEGASPVSFPRLVQPVLDRGCVECHERESSNKVAGLAGRPGKRHGWTASYEALAPHAWALSGGNGIFNREGARSTAGRVGARASGLLPFLGPGHHGVSLTPEDKQRVVLWLDTNSNFYGAYHDLGEQARGARVEPALR